MAATPRAGDTVLQRPTGETWVVAHADADRKVLAWVGWPPGYARLSDCELKTQCSDEQHVKQLMSLPTHALPTRQATSARATLSGR